MKPVFLLTFSAALALAAPVAAQEFYGTVEPPVAYDDGYLRSPRPVGPPVGAYEEPRGTVVTTTRRIVSPPDETGFGTTRTVTTTRRVVQDRGEPLAVYGGGPIVSRTVPHLRDVVTKDPYGPSRLGETGYRAARFGGPLLVAPPRVAPRPPMVIEERRVETTRRYLSPEVEIEED